MQTCGNSFPHFLSRAVSLSFLFNLTQTNKATNETHLIEREREIERYLPHCHLSIHLFTLSIHHHHVQQGTTTRIYRSGNLQLSPRALRTPRPSSHPRRMDSTCCRYVVSFIQMFLISSRVVCTPPTKNIRSVFFSKEQKRD